MSDVEKMMEARNLKELKEYADKLQKKIAQAQKIYSQKVPYAGEMHRIIPEARLASVIIDHKVTTEKEVLFENLVSATTDRLDRVCRPGTYTRLLVRREKPDPDDGKEWDIMMTDAPYEIRSSMEFIKKARGDVLVTGLGLGATLLPVLKKKSVRRVTVIEKNGDIVSLVYPHIITQPGGEKLTVVLSDALSWAPTRGVRYDTIWLDIWPDVSTSNLIEMRLLKKKYGRYLGKKGWIGVWEWEWLHKREQELVRNSHRALGMVGGDVRQSLTGERTVITSDGRKLRL